MGQHHITLKEEHSLRLKRLCEQEDMTQPQIVARALKCYEDRLNVLKKEDAQ